MNTFTNAVINQEARTENGMKARVSTSDKVVDFFYQAGASRGKNIVPLFTGAYVENPDRALRVAQWLRDIREGAGERQLFRDILTQHAKTNIPETKALIDKVPELGRWDDLLVFVTGDFGPELANYALSLIKSGLDAGNGLTAKWMPRKGPEAVVIRNYLGLSPKSYRKLLVNLTKVVESQMCANEWDDINFSHVPSVASSRYKKAFGRHTPRYGEYVEALVKGDPSVKVNASAIYPYEILKGLITYYRYDLDYSKTELDHIVAQWNALPNYVGDNKVLALVDVSGSMTAGVGGSTKVTCLDVAVSLGLYVADKNVGPFKDTFLTFSGTPSLMNLKGDIVDKANQMVNSNWAMNTNLHAAFDKILSVAVKGKVPQNEMPSTLLIMSDMQFDRCVTFDDNAFQMIKRKYSNAGYDLPKIVFWNLRATDNVPVKSGKNGVALVSGFSPNILKAILSNKLEKFTPENIMLETIMKPRYDLNVDKAA